MILKERGRPLVRNRRRDKNGSVCLARPVRVVDMLVRCIRRHSTRDEKITATLLPSTLRQPRRGSRPSNLALQTRVSGAESLARGPCRRRPRSAILFRSRARGCSEGISWQPLRWSLVSWSWIWVSARRHNGAVALAEMFTPLGVPAFSFARGGRQLTRGHGGEREDGVEARSRAAVRARGRRGKDPKEHERSDVGVSTPRFPQALNSPVPPVWTSWGGGASYRALLIVAQTLITQPPWRISSLFDDNDTTLGSWNCAATKSPCYRATISTAPHKSRNLPRPTFLMAHILI